MAIITLEVGIMEIVAGIHKIDGVNGNCYIIGDGTLTLIDTGMPNNSAKILAYIKQMGKKPEDIKTIILTHSHIDHIGSLDAMKKATGAEVAAHRDEADFISHKKQMPMPNGAMALVIKVLGTVMKTHPVEVDVLLDEGAEVAGFTVLHTPGHTPGSIALLDSKRGIILVGDTLRVARTEWRGRHRSAGTLSWRASP